MRSGEAAYTFSLPFVSQKEVGCGTKSHEVKEQLFTEAAKPRFVRQHTTRACSHKINMQIFEHNFVACKAKFCRNIIILQKILTQQAAKFAEKMRIELYVNTL